MKRIGVANEVLFKITADHASLERDRETVMHLVAELEAVGDGVETDRPPMTVVFALDVSGSMAGEPIEQVKRSTRRMIEMLRPDDRAGVVAFTTHASVVADVVTTEDSAKRNICRAIQLMYSQQSTNIEDGLRLAHKIMPARRANERRVVILLSDGMPTTGKCSASDLAALANAVRANASTSTLGFGHSHSEPLLSAISDAGGGNYRYIRDPALSQLQFAAVLSAQGDIVAENIELAIAPHADVEVLGVIGLDRTRYKRGTFLIDAPDLVARAKHRLAIRVRVRTPKECGLMRLADATLRYKPAGLGDVRTIEEHVAVQVTRDPSAVALMPIRTVLILRAEDERKKARELADKGRYAEAASLLRDAASMIELLPGFDKSDGSELSEACDQLRDDADLYDQRPDAAAYAEFRRGQRLGVGGNFSPVEELAAKASSRALIDDAAGPIPNAMLINVHTSERFPLSKPVNVIGRSKMADISVASSRVSRQSASIVAQSGAFWLQDLGSANGVWMNGMKVDKKRLTDGDVILIGDVSLRYEANDGGAS